MADTQKSATVGGTWVLSLICCGQDYGTELFQTWQAADDFRNSFTDPDAVAQRPYGRPDLWGHERAAILTYVDLPTTAGSFRG